MLSLNSQFRYTNINLYCITPKGLYMSNTLISHKRISKMGYKNFQINLEEEDVRKVDVLGDKIERSRSYLIRKAILLLLKKYDEENKNEVVKK